MSEIIKMLKQAIKKLEGELSKPEQLTKEEQARIESKLESYRGMLEELKAISENVLQSRIAPTGRGAMFQLRKAFYALVSRGGYDRDASVNEWKKVATRLVEFMNEKGLSDVPTKIILEYEEVEENGKKYLKFKSAKIAYFEPAGMFTLDFEKGGPMRSQQL